MTARDDALEADTGLMAALSPTGRVDRTTDPQFGTRWLIEKAGLNIKKYPTVGASQRCIDAILELKKTTDVPADRIVAIRPRVSVKHAKVMPFDAPRRPAEAKFSLSFACAAAIRFGQVTLAELRQDSIDDPLLRRLMGKVAVDAVEDYDPDYPVAAPWDIVQIDLGDGRTLETPKIRRASGHADNPLSVDAIWHKFKSCADTASISEVTARRLFDWCQQVDSQSDISGLQIAPS
jgi:2-methylcitrate dehydratase PrpD